ncbi:hypothetical protein Tco_1064365 [Tanacetum coccineum]
MTKSEEYVTKAREDYYSSITKTMINGKAAYELKGKFLDDLQKNAFSGTNEEDMIEHIENFLMIVDPLDLPNVSYEQLRLPVFHISLTRDASKWIMNEPQRDKTYEEYENEWSYKLNNDPEEPWSENGVPYELIDHICEPFHFKDGKTKWPTCSSNDDGFCNGENLPGIVRIGYITYFKDYKWYDDLIDGNLKEEALKQKAIYEGSWGIQLKE